MDDESSTPNTPEPHDEVQEVIYGEVVKTRAEAAYELKLSGKSLSTIADELGYASTTEVAHAIKTRFKVEAEFISDAGRTGMLQMELDRLDRLQEVLWPAAMTGDPKSAEAVLKVMDRRAKYVGFDHVDTATQQHTVLIMGATEQDYVEKLKELSE